MDRPGWTTSSLYVGVIMPAGDFEGMGFELADTHLNLPKKSMSPVWP